MKTLSNLFIGAIYVMAVVATPLSTEGLDTSLVKSKSDENVKKLLRGSERNFDNAEPYYIQVERGYEIIAPDEEFQSDCQEDKPVSEITFSEPEVPLTTYQGFDVGDGSDLSEDMLE